MVKVIVAMDTVMEAATSKYMLGNKGVGGIKYPAPFCCYSSHHRNRCKTYAEQYKYNSIKQILEIW